MNMKRTNYYLCDIIPDTKAEMCVIYRETENGSYVGYAHYVLCTVSTGFVSLN